MSSPDERDRHRPDRPKLLERKWVGPVFLLSLLLNLFLLGLLGTGTLHHWGRDGMRGVDMAMGGARAVLADSLSDEERDLFRQAMHAHFRDIRPHFGNVRAARVALGQAIAIEPYDEEAVGAAFGELRQAMDVVAVRSQGALAKTFATLPAETRARIGENLARERHRRGNRQEGRVIDEGAPGAGQLEQ